MTYSANAAHMNQSMTRTVALAVAQVDDDRRDQLRNRRQGDDEQRSLGGRLEALERHLPGRAVSGSHLA
jgi:hypothetical protein